MKKRYIVCINNSTAEQEQLFINYAKENGLGWWHWLNNVWFLVDSSNKVSSEVIRDKIIEIFNGEFNIVVELNSNGVDTWNGYGPSSENNDMFRWVDKNWK